MINEEELNNILFMSEVLIKVTAMQNLLIAKKIFTLEEVNDELMKVTKIVTESFLKNSKKSQEIENVDLPVVIDDK